jgi:hypothetical protein
MSPFNLKPALYASRSLALEEGLRMMIFTEKIERPPPLPLTNEEQMKLIAESLASDDRWIRNLIDGLAGILRAVKH